MARIDDDDYRRLLEFRTVLRHFTRWSEQEAIAAGVTPAHHQLLLAVRGHPGPAAPTIGEVADSLLLRHHSAVELVDRAEAVELVRRTRDRSDGRIVRIELTARARRLLRRLSERHLEELRRLAPRMRGLYDGLEPLP
jgi:DNA-binding MarR family transcriptional regulator